MHRRQIAPPIALLIALIAGLVVFSFPVFSTIAHSDAGDLPQTVDAVIGRAPTADSVNGVLAQDDPEIKQVAFAPRGGWVVLYGTNGFQSQNIPSGAADELMRLNNEGSEITRIAFSPSGGYVIFFDWNGYTYAGIPSEMGDYIAQLNDDQYGLHDVAFTPDGGWVVIFRYDDYSGLGGARWSALPRAAGDQLDSHYSSDNIVNTMAFGPGDSWLVVFNGNGFNSVGMADPVADELYRINDGQWDIKSVAFGQRGSWAIIYGWNGWVVSSNAPQALEDTLDTLN